MVSLNFYCVETKTRKQVGLDICLAFRVGFFSFFREDLLRTLALCCLLPSR